MAGKRLFEYDFNQNQALNLRLHILASAPSSPVTGQPYFDSVLGYARCWDGSTWIRIDDHWVSGVSGTPPINSSGGATPVISITAASGSDPGSMSAAHFSLVNGATAVNTASTVVRRDASGNFAAGTIATTMVSLSGTPSASTDATTKAYVDAVASNTDVKTSVRVATTANVNLSSAPAAIDGVTLVAGNRVLLKDQTTASQNGVYVFAGTGLSLTRAADADASAEVTSGMQMWVSEGDDNANTYWIITTPDPIVLGTTALAFTQFGAGVAYAADGATLTLTGSTFSIHSNYVGQTSITTLGTIVTGTWNATIIGLTKGGLGVDASNAAGKLTARQNLNVAGKYSALIGNGSSTSIAITQATHGLASDGTIGVWVRDATSDDEYDCGVKVNNTNGTVTLTFSVAPATNSLRVTLMG
jgi:hypothetical protein